MGEKTAISWAHASFSAWWGCTEVSPGCDACYARSWAERTGFHVWGKDAPRRFFGDKHWQEPIRWNRKAAETGEPHRVFCQSMSDLGEERSDSVGRELEEARLRLWELIRATPALDWLLLTKRPRLYRALMPQDIAERPNVWRGVSVESPAYLWRVDQLLQSPGAGPAWVSYEPALEWVDFEPYLWLTGPSTAGPWRDVLGRRRGGGGVGGQMFSQQPSRDLSWIVVGGESQQPTKAACRPIAPFDVQWALRSISIGRVTDTKIFVKQMGARPYDSAISDNPEDRGAWLDLRDKRAGADPTEWPEALRVQEFPR